VKSAWALAALLLLLPVLGASTAGRNGTMGSLSFSQESSLPPWVLSTIQGSRARVAPCACINPYYQRGDFDGDGSQEYAVMVRDSSSSRIGIAFVRRRDLSIRIVGAGRVLGKGGDDFAWMDAWRVFDRGPVARGVGEGTPPILRGDALLVEKTESASALIWWDGKTYRWYQQGD
jgi:hypothetical protein